MRTAVSEINIWSFYRAPVELLTEMRAWREFSAGDDNSVDLKDAATGESVKVEYVVEWDDNYLTIKSVAPGALFDSVVGRVVCALTERSGYLKIRSTPYDEKVLFTPKFKQTSD